MDASPFSYNSYVTGKNNFARKLETSALVNMLSQGENVVIYEPPKSGKSSVVQQAILNMKVRDQKFTVAQCNLSGVRTASEFALRIASALISAVSPSAEECASAVNSLLAGTHFVFDPREYSANGMAVGLNWDLDESDLRAALTLPYKISVARAQKVIVLVEELQNLPLCEDDRTICKVMQEVVRTAAENGNTGACWLLCGSSVNALDELFTKRGFLYKNIERLKLQDTDPKEIADYVNKGFLSAGKVLDRNLIMGMCKLFKCNLWYINHFASICDSRSKGYMTEPVLTAALESLVAIHQPRFCRCTEGLTFFQLRLLRAILDGYTQFSSADVIKKYSLHSSANVLRVKEALCKKEIILFDDEGVPQIQDPLFEYWLKTEFFKIATSG